MKIVKKRRKLRVKRIVLLIIVLLMPIFCTIFYYNKFKLNIKYKKEVNIEINSKMYNLDNIKNIKNGKIITKKEKVDSSKLGKKEIKIKVKPNLTKEKTYSYTVNVVDTIKPKIKYQDKITVSIDSNIDLLDSVEVTDNSKEVINPKIVGDYDLGKEGKYKLKYIAEDSSGNKCSEDFILEVSSSNSNKAFKSNSKKTSNGHNMVVKDGITYVDGILIANKTYSLPSTYNPGGLTDETMTAFNKMSADAKAVGLSLFVVSGFRSYDTQNTLYNNYVSKDGKEAADTYSARPGHSEHQSGLAFDLNLVDVSFENTNEGRWLNENCYRYGFILRYPKGKTNETGYIYEAWHFRYVGVDLATKLYNNGDWITLEKYFGLTSEYNY